MKFGIYILSAMRGSTDMENILRANGKKLIPK